MRHHHLRFLAVALVTTALPLPLLAQSAPDTTRAATPAQSTAISSRPVWGYVRFAGDYGGDALGTVYFTDGSKSDIQAGGGIDLVAGVVFRPVDTPAGGLDAQLGAGVKWRTIPNNSNQDANWVRVPVDATLAWRTASGFGLGAGTTIHLANTFSGSGAVFNSSVSFDPSFGKVAFLEYGRREWQIDLRYTHLTYTSSNPRSTLDASNIGVGLTWQFGR